MNKQLLAAAALALAPLLAGCLAEAGGAASVDRPVWQSGYAYSFVTTGKARLMESQDGDTDRRTEDFDPTRRVAEVLNTSLTAEGERFYLAAMTLPGRTVPMVDFEEGFDADGDFGMRQVPLTFLVAHRQRDLASVGVGYSTSDSCVNDACSFRISRINVDGGPSYSWLDFPLETGKTWSTVLEAEETGGWNDDVASGLDVRVRAKVIGMETIELPVGSTRAVRVDYTYKPIGIEEWKRDVLEEAKDEGATLETFDYSAGSAQRLWYSPDYQNVVLSESTLDVNLRVSGTDDDGERFDYAMSVNIQTRDELDGARLVPRPERGYDYIAQVLYGGIPIEDPAGNAFQPNGYSVQLSADKTTVNAAESETAAFVARIVGADALPDGHTAAWRILDAQSRVVTEGEGLAFEHAFTQPGAYAVEIETRDDSGATTAADGVTVVANYEAVLPNMCDPVTVPFFIQGCEEAPLPVRLGIRTLEVSVERSAPVAFANFGNIVLTDAVGNQYFEQNSADGESIRIDDFSEFPVNGDDWSMRWQPTTSVLETVDYHIRLLYGPEGDSAPTAEVSATEPAPPPPPSALDLAQVMGGLRGPGARGVAPWTAGPMPWAGGVGAVA